jgi:hypothetical protein
MRFAVVLQILKGQHGASRDQDHVESERHSVLRGLLSD